MKLISLKNDQEETQEDMENETPAKPEYSYGTCLHLDEEALQKLGIKSFPEIGTEWKIEAVAKVTGMSQSASESHDYKCLDLQITKMGIGAKLKTSADILYSED